MRCLFDWTKSAPKHKFWQRMNSLQILIMFNEMWIIRSVFFCFSLQAKTNKTIIVISLANSCCNYIDCIEKNQSLWNFTQDMRRIHSYVWVHMCIWMFIAYVVCAWVQALLFIRAYVSWLCEYVYMRKTKHKWYIRTSTIFNIILSSFKCTYSFKIRLPVTPDTLL